jgi:hypothetical protein
MGIKVVYNACYGGYGLSDKAIEMLNGLSGGLVDRDNYHTLPRHDMNLVLVIEALGSAANDEWSGLNVVEIESDRYRISGYDGWECVETPETIQWVVVPQGGSA